jgi:hypothetical protein
MDQPRPDSFMHRYCGGQLSADALEDFVEAWHAGDTTELMSQFLGMSQAEYAAWVANPQAFFEAANQSLPTKAAVSS